jgi:hypothetical protein
MEALHPLYAQAVDGARKHLPGVLSQLADSTGMASDGLFEVLNSPLAANFKRLMIFLRIMATGALLYHAYWFSAKLWKISLKNQYESDAKRQTEVARALAENTLWLGSQRGVMPLIWDIWLSLIILAALVYCVRTVLEKQVGEYVMRAVADGAAAYVKH